MTAKIRASLALASVALAAVALTGCSSAEDAQLIDQARNAVTDSYQLTGWSDDMDAAELQDSVNNTVSVAKLACTNGGYTPSDTPQLGHATIAAMAVLCPDVTP